MLSGLRNARRHFEIVTREPSDSRGEFAYSAPLATAGEFRHKPRIPEFRQVDALGIRLQPGGMQTSGPSLYDRLRLQSLRSVIAGRRSFLAQQRLPALDDVDNSCIKNSMPLANGTEQDACGQHQTIERQILWMPSSVWRSRASRSNGEAAWWGCNTEQAAARRSPFSISAIRPLIPRGADDIYDDDRVVSHGGWSLLPVYPGRFRETSSA